MNRDFEQFVNSVDSSNIEKFIANTKSKLILQVNDKKIESDMSWIEVVDKAIPYLENIIRNPRRFIRQEEDVVIIEKAKKVTRESIKHLSQHANLIEDVMEDGNVRPKKILNVYKEDTIDLYENRFIYSLLMALKKFVSYKKVNINTNYGSMMKKKMNYNSSTIVKDEKINFNLSLEISNNHNPEEIRKDEEKILKHIQQIEDIVSEFENTSFIKSLISVNLVKSPIRKTNIILKDVNFQQCVILWEYMEKNLEKTSLDIRKDEVEIIDSPVINRNLDYSYFISYNALLLDNKEEMVNKDKKKLIEKLITELMDNGQDEKQIKKSISKMYKRIYNQREKIYGDISKIYKKYIKSYERNKMNAIELLK